MTDSQAGPDLALIDLFVQGCLTNEESDAFWLALQDDEEFVQQFRDNIRADYLLKEKKRLLYPNATEKRHTPTVRLSEEEVSAIAAEIRSMPKKHQGKYSLVLSPDDDILTDLAELVVWEKNAPGIKRKEAPEKRSSRSWILGVCFLFPVLIAAWLIVDMTVRELHNNFNPPIVAVKPEDYSVCLAEMIDAVWDGEAFPLSFKRGQFIDSDKLSLKSGMIKLEFQSGTTLHLEGPAELVINNDKKCFCQKGQMSVHVPAQGVGFEIGTPLGKIIDHGTEFYAKVSPVDVQMGVVQGRVEIRTKKGEVEMVATGHEVKVGPALTVARGNADQKRYIAPDTFQAMLRDSVEKFVQKREETKRRTIAEPDLLAFYSLLDKRNGYLENQASSAKRESTANIYSCSKTPGPLHGESALAFFNRSSRIVSSLPAELQSLTVVMDIRIDNLANPSNGLMVAGDFGNTGGSFNWFVTMNGELNLFIQNTGQQTRSENRFDQYQTPIVLTKSYQGTWCQVALVLDGNKKTITQYMDGAQVAVDTWRNPIPISVNKIVFGNGPKIDGNLAAGNLGGAVSNIRVYNRPLEPGELKPDHL